MKKYKVCYCVGITLSLLVGLWHFFVPWLFQWYSYIPEEYENLIVGIDWVNLCFSLFLSGTSAILLCLRKSVFKGNPEALIFYGFLTLVWIFRAAIALIEPWPLEPVAWVAYGQLLATAAIVLLLLIPLVKLLKMRAKAEEMH